MIRRYLFLVVVLALVLSACVPSAAQAKTAFCNSLQVLQQAAAQVGSITKDTTVDQAKQYVAAYEAAWQNVAKANQTLKSAQFNELQAAHNNLDQSLKSINDQTTLEAAVPQIQAAYKDYATKVNEIRDVNCK